MNDGVLAVGVRVGVHVDGDAGAQIEHPHAEQLLIHHTHTLQYSSVWDL